MTKEEACLEWGKNQPTAKRSNPVRICWQTINNAQLINIGLHQNMCENWKDMFAIMEDGGFKESYYISDLMRVFFGDSNLGTDPGKNTFYEANPDNKRKFRKLITDLRKRFDEDADSIIYTPCGNNIHTVLFRLLSNIVDKEKYDIKIIDGGDANREGTTNKDCERISTKASEEVRKNGKRMIFISSIMGTRSWSNKYVKNIFLLYDSGSFDTTNQRIARAWTPWEEHDICYIFDFRLTYEYPTIVQSFIANNLIRKEKYTEESVNEIIKTILSTDKIEFIDVYGDVDNPFKILSFDDIKKMLLSNKDFESYAFYQNVDINEITNPIQDIKNQLLKNTSGLKSENKKGDFVKQIKRKNKLYCEESEKKYTNEQKEKDLKIKYIEFIKNNGKLFNPQRFTENVINNIYDNIDNYKTLIEDPDRLNMTFQTVKDIIYQFKECPINFDNSFLWK